MITLVTGGQRSGKSKFAEEKALGVSSKHIYVATARVWDEEIRHRVEIHQQRRGNMWINIEEPLHISKIEVARNSMVLLDCLTMLASNWFFESNQEYENTISELKKQLDAFFSQKSDFIVVTNEIGLGGISPNEMQRKFADLQGEINRYVASLADEVYFVVSGIPVKIK